MQCSTCGQATSSLERGLCPACASRVQQIPTGKRAQSIDTLLAAPRSPLAAMRTLPPQHRQKLRLLRAEIRALGDD